MSQHALINEMKANESEFVEIRRTLHRHPEVGFEEIRTSQLIARHLRSWGLDVVEGIAKTGIVATLRGKGSSGRSIGLRADMDALWIDEVPGREHGSLVPGKMHACGHDGHTAMLLGAARHLARRPDFAGTVNFIFQPAEEGLGGGRRMIEEGLFERFPVDAIYGMHNWPGIPTGEFRTRTGPFFAANDIWSVIFRGTGGHGGVGAHLGTDVTLAQAEFLLALQTIVSRNIPATEAAVVSVGHIAAGAADAPNIIPSQATVTGTARSFSPDVRDTIEQRLGEIARAHALAFGCTAEIAYQRLSPALVTQAEQTARSLRVAEALVGREKVGTEYPLVTASEDFSFMLEAKPGGYILIGNGMPHEGFANLHTPDYDFNDDILALGSAYWVHLVRTELAPTSGEPVARHSPMHQRI